MKKPNLEQIEQQVRINIRDRKQFKGKSNSRPVSYTTYSLLNCIDINNKQYRHAALKAINSLKGHQNTHTRPYFDFGKVQILMPMATIYFKQLLEKYSLVKCRGRASSNSVVSGMLSKLNISQRIGLKTVESSHNLVERWYFFSGENTDLGDDYDEIENVLIEKFGEDSETFDLINTAIGEAIINVVNHAYRSEDDYKKWYLFLSITKDNCSVVISDLGQTIPNTIPLKISDTVLATVFNVSSWSGLKDDAIIEIATQYQKTATKLPNRGKGFQDMQAVCDQVKGSTMMVHSRSGYWGKKNDEKVRFKKQNYKSAVNGTIISWVLPLDNSSIVVNPSLPRAN